MKYKDGIDLFAAIGKLDIETSNLTQDEKEYQKTRIDISSELLKSIAPTDKSQPTVFGCSLDMIKRIKETAQQCKVEKVVLIPVPNHIGHGGPLIKCHGKASENFLNQMNRIRISDEIFQRNGDLIASCEKAFGVIIYEHEN